VNESLIERPFTVAGQNSEPELISLRRFRADLGVVPSTAWRWVQRGWLGRPVNIGGRLYLTREQIAEFKRRAEAGEFASNIKPPRPTVER
jgi:predicted DNA-binding transcriptional regulator AlpA